MVGSAYHVQTWYQPTRCWITCAVCRTFAAARRELRHQSLDGHSARIVRDDLEWVAPGVWEPRR